jgi:hypothetical protein
VSPRRKVERRPARHYDRLRVERADPGQVETLTWHQDAEDFVDDTGMDRAIIEAAARFPTSTSPDPRSATEGYPIKRLRRGDIEVVVGYREPKEPMILFVRLETPGEGRSMRSASAGGGHGSSIPPTMTEMHRRIQALGYHLSSTTRHTKVLTRDGAPITTLPRTPSDNRSLANAWMQFQRAHQARLAEAENSKKAKTGTGRASE